MNVIAGGAGGGGGDGTLQNASTLAGVQFAAASIALPKAPTQVPHLTVPLLFAFPHACSSVVLQTHGAPHSVSMQPIHVLWSRRYGLQHAVHPYVQVAPVGGMQEMFSCDEGGRGGRGGPGGGDVGHGHWLVPQLGHGIPGPPGVIGGHISGG